MTIIQPNLAKAKVRVVLFIGASLAVLLGISVFGVSTYTRTVDLRHRITRIEAVISDLSAENADLKNQVYTLLSPEHLTDVGRSLGLELEKRPNYLEATVDVLATQL